MLAFYLNPIKSQPYLPLFIPDSTEWSVNYIGVNGLLDGNDDFNFNVVLNNSDTLIISENGANLFTADSLKISVNQDNSKAWVFIDSLNRDLLIYDITLEIGDSFMVYSFYDTIFDSTYLKVENVYFQDNRKVIEFENKGFFPIDYFRSLSFVEGVGPANFFTYWYTSIYVNYAPYNTICKQNNNNLDYTTFFESYNYEDCKTITSVFDLQYSSLDIYPNPSNSILHFNIDIEEVLVFNSLGKIVLQRTNVNNNLFDISNLDKGIYFVKIKEGSNFYVNKIIKE